MIGFLRLVGLLNSAVWLGAAAFYTFAIGPAASSQDVKDLLEPANYPYFSGAIAQVLIARYFRWQLACSAVAVLHVLAEWLYFGKIPHKLWLGLLAGLVSVNLLGGLWLEPRLSEWHTIRYAVNSPAKGGKRLRVRLMHGKPSRRPSIS